jgi:hypothetical protein
MPTILLQDIFRGVVVIDVALTGEICYLCENCNQEKQRLMEEFKIY